MKANRRTFLTSAALAGVAASLPGLPGIPSPTSGQTGGAKRLLLITTGNGSILPNWRPQRSGTRLANGDALEGSTSAILHPILQRHFANTVLVDGLDMAAIRSPDGVWRDTSMGGGHYAHQTIWTGRFRGGRDYTGPSEGGGTFPDGQSLDQFIANGLGVATPVHSVRLATNRVYRENEMLCASYDLAGNPLIPEANPTLAYRELFGDYVVPDETMDWGPERKRRRLSILRNEVLQLQSRLPAADQVRLQAHLSGFQDLEERLSVPRVVCDPGTEPVADDYATRAEAHKSLIRQAFACDRTRVINYSLTPEVDWTRAPEVFLPGWTGEFGEVHLTSHSTNRPDGGIEDFQLLKRWEAEWVADLVDELKNTPDPLGGSVFDSTLIVWCTAMSHGAEHYSRNTPCVVIAGDSVGFRTNQYLRAEEAHDVGLYYWVRRSPHFQELSDAIGHGFPNNQLLVSIARAFGHTDLNQFGDSRFSGALEGLV